MRLGLGLGLTGQRGASGPSLNLSANSILESAVSGSTVGVLSVANHPSGSSGWTFAETADPDNKFTVSGSNLNTSASLNYEAATSHSVTITASKVGEDDIVRVFTITVTNVLEVTLGALALDSLSFAEGTADSGSITGKTSGSTVTLVGSLPAGLTLDLTAMTWAWDGTGTISDGSFTLRETHADASNSPNDSVQAWEIVEASAEPTLEIIFTAIENDSLELGVSTREAGDTRPANVWYWRETAPAGISTILPLDHINYPGGSDFLAWSECNAKEREAITGLPTYVVPAGVGGSSIALDSSTSFWGVGKTNHEESISRANAAIVDILAANPGAVPMFTISVAGGTNDSTGGGDADVWETRILAAALDFCSRVFKNGVSGETIGNDAVIIFRGLSPEYRAPNFTYANPIEVKQVKMMYALPNARYVKQPEGQNNGDNVHPTNAGQRGDGLAAANARDDSVSPVITLPDFSIYEGQKLARKIITDKPAWPHFTGTDASEFEAAWLADRTATPANIGNSRIHPYLRFAGDGDAPAPGTYNFTLNAKGNAPAAGTKSVVATVVAAYGSQTETIVPVWSKADGFTDLFDGRMRQSSVALKRGVNAFHVLKVAGTADISTSAVASNGLVGVRHPSSDGSAALFYFYSAQDETVDYIDVTYTGSSPGIWGFNLNLVGTVATPTAYETTTSATSSSITCPTNGIIICAGYATGGTTPTSGATGLTDSPTDGAMYACYRTTTGAIGAQGGFARLIATSWAKA